MIDSIYELKILINNIIETIITITINKKIYYYDASSLFYIYDKDKIYYQLNDNINEVFKHKIISSKKLIIDDIIKDRYNYLYLLNTKNNVLEIFNIKKHKRKLKLNEILC